MSGQLELGFDATFTQQPDGSIRVDPGRLRVKEVEDWRWFSEVMRTAPHLLPGKNRSRIVILFHTKEIRARRRGKLGNWEIEMNSLEAYMKSLEDF